MMGGGKEILNEFYKSYNVNLADRRQHHLSDGRLVFARRSIPSTICRD